MHTSSIQPGFAVNLARLCPSSIGHYTTQRQPTDTQNITLALLFHIQGKNTQTKAQAQAHAEA